MSLFERHAAAIGAVSALITAIVAVAALIGVKVQLDAADHVQRSQSAREAYRAHLALAAGMPAFALPQNGCALIASEQGGAYAAFVDHLLYSAEQMLSVQPDWQASFLDDLAVHSDYLCTAPDSGGDSDELSDLLTRFRQSRCIQHPGCG